MDIRISKLAFQGALFALVWDGTTRGTALAQSGDSPEVPNNPTAWAQVNTTDYSITILNPCNQQAQLFSIRYQETSGADHNKDANGNHVLHWHFQSDYEDGGVFQCPHAPSHNPQNKTYVDLGNEFWHAFYGEYSNLPQRYGGCTNQKNCFAYAFDGYCGSAQAQFWTANSEEAEKYINDCNVVEVLDYNQGYQTQGGEICCAYEYGMWVHAWYIAQGLQEEPVQMWWKNNSSPVYVWTHNGNDAARGYFDDMTYTFFSIVSNE